MSGANETVSLSLIANMDISQVLGGVKAIQNGFNGLKIDPKIMGDLTKEFSNLQGYVKEFQKIMGKENISKTDIKNLQNLEKSINSSFSNVIKLQQQLNGSQIMSKVDSSQLDELVRKTEAARTALNDAFSNIKFGENSGILQLENGIEKAVGRSKTLKTAFADAFADLKTGNVDQFVSKIDGAFNNLEGKLKNGKLETTAQGLIKTFQQLGLINIDVKTDTAKQKIDALKLGFEGIKTAIANGASGNEIQQLIQDLEKATNEENEFRQVALQNGQISMGKLAEDTNKVAAGARDAAKAEREFQAASLSATQQVQQLQQSAQYFFSLRNMINLLRQGLREAVSTVKELDAAMTETAVVTDFSVSDMWGKLPEYTANANALGATVKDMYESTTLYYQQGLNAEQSMSIASETMKMARIAGLDAADATDKMTAALRGFNMEINEASAQRINDVYSNLAAKTASDTEELGTAMQRTASIAASAGMSFEGTAAFLAQAIETTREPAENIGTAMKTIIARMQEMKKNPLEIGEVDGEEVNYNKIDAALQSIGVSLKAANGDFRDNDEVLLDISQRWDSLTQTQQRYIATSIAGSRQQSRFIAMVSDYGRTLELMDYANNAEGASQEQFGKTLDSLEAKLNKFQNAWKKFLMNIMNDSWTKGIVDGATSALNAITKLIDTLSFEKKGLKSILSIATAFTALKIGGRGVNALIGGLGGLVDPKVGLKEGFRTGAFGGQAAKISNPIVKAIYSLIPHIDGAVTGEKYKHQQYGNFKGAKEDLSKQLFSQKTSLGTELNQDAGTYSLSKVQGIFDKNQLNKEQQKALYASFPGLQKSMTKNLASIIQKSAESPEAAKGLIAGFKNGEITAEQVLERGGAIIPFTKRMEKITTAQGEEAARTYKNGIVKELNTKENLTKELYKQGKSQGLKGADLTRFVGAGIDQRLLDKKVGIDSQTDEALNKTIKLSNAEQLANSFGRVGGALTTAGMSLQMFGAQISAIHPVIGAVITQLGGLVTALGTLPNIVSSIVAGGPVVWGITAAVVALGAAFYKAKKHVDGIKKSADKVVKSFKDTNKQTQDNIASLKTYMTQANYWSQNVDKNGYNVGLGDDEYKQYLDAVDKIANLNPDVVKGYNAQGHAIVDINSALKDTIKLEKQRQEEVTKEYLKDSTGDKITKARDVNKDFLKVTREMNSAPIGAWRVTNWLGTELIDKNFGTDWFSHAVTPFQKQVGEIVDSLKSEISNPDEFYKQFSIDYNKLLSQDEQEIYRFVKNRNDIYSKALEANGGELSDKITNKFTDLDDLSEKFDAATQDQKEWLNTYVSSLDSFKNIPEELKGNVLEGLDHIAIQPNLNFSDMQDQADAMLSTFDNLTREGGDYQKAMEDVAKAQESFASSMDPSEYADKTRKALNNLDKLYQQYAKDTSAYGQAVAEFLQNQIERIEKFPEEGSITLAEALNTHASEVQGAEGAFAAFQESTKSDFATGAENMKSIYDEIVKETDGVQLHLQGGGDNTLWTGMNSLFSKEAVDKAAAGGEDAVRSMLNRVEPMLQEGRAGFDAFWTDMFSPERVKALKDIKGLDIDPENWEMKWDEDINPDVFHEMAEALDYSDSFLASMLNKGRQFADLDFMDMSQARKALSTDEAAIKGTTTTTITNDKGEQETVTDRYVKEDYLRNALAEAQIVNPQEQNEAIEKMEDEGIKIIPGADSITPKELNNLGIKDMSSAITTLGDTGQFNRNEIEEYAKNLKDFNPEEFGTLYDDYLASQEHPELPTLTSIEGNVAAIASIVGSNRVKKGYADESTIAAYEEAKKLVNGENGWRKGEADSISELFALGKNKEGKKLTDAEYKTTSELLDKQIKAYEKQATLAEKGAQKAEEEGRQTDADELSKEAAGYAELARRLLLDKEQGEKNYSEQERRDKEAADRESEAKSYSDKEKSNWEKTDVTPEEYVKAREEGRKAQDFTEENKNLAQQYVDNLQQGVAGAFSNINPAIIANNPQMLSAAEVLSKTVSGEITPKPEQITSALSQLGIEQGSFAYDAFFQHIQSKVQDTDAKLDQATNDAVNSGIPNVGYVGLASTPLYNKIQAKITEWWNGLTKEPEIPEVKTDSSSFASKVQAKIKTWWDNLTKTPQAPESTSSGTQPEIKQPTVQAEPTKYQVDNSEAISKTQELKSSAQETIDTINTPATMTISAPGAETLKTAAKDAKKLKGAASGSKNFNVTASVSGTDKIKPFNAAAKEAMSLSSHSVNYTARTSGTGDVLNAVSAGHSFQNLYDKTVTYTTVHKTVNENGPATGGYITSTGVIYRAKGGRVEHPGYPKKGTDTIPAYLTPGEYVQNRKAVQYFGIDFMRRINHRDLAGALQSFGSAARGQYGRLGPKGSGGLTLTGEKGFEIAWIPSESRSMILGATGPQMLNLPSDAIIYTHEQSKKILKQKAIPAGSHSGKAKYEPVTTTTTTTTTTTSSSKGDRKGNGSQQKKIEQEQITLINKAGKVVVWWDNQGRKVDQLLRNADKSQKAFDNLIKKASISVGTVEASAKTAVQDYLKSIKANQTSLARAKSELTAVNKGTAAQQSANKQYNKANTKKNRNTLKELEKDKKKAKTEKAKQKIQKKIDKNALTKAKKARKKANEKAVALGTSAEISWEQTKKTKKNGKTKKTKVTKKANVNMSGYIKKVNGVLMLDQKKINAEAKKNKSKAEAIRDAGNKIIQDKTSKKNTAEDNIEKAREAIAKMGQDIFDTFYGWENTLTHIYNITQKIEQVEKQISNLKGGQELVETRLAAGYLDANSAMKESLPYMKGATRGQVGSIQLGTQAIKAQKAQVQQAVNKGSDIQTLINVLNREIKGSSNQAKKELKIAERDAAQERLNAINKAKKYADVTPNKDGTVSLDIKVDKLEKDRLSGQITEAEFNEITKYLEDIQTENNNLLDEYDKQTARFNELYQSIADLKKSQADAARELFDQYVENQKQEIENTKQLSDAINNAFKELIEQVKQGIAQRRQQEDNRKTEQDISQKQQRLAMLRADTSGGNAVQIAQLQKEITDAQQSYGRTLEDQMLERLQQQNDAAYQQREQQLALMESMHDIYVQNGFYASHINQLLTDANNPETRAKANAEIAKLLKEELGYEGLPQAVKDVVDTEIQQKTLDIDTYKTKFETLSTAVANTSTDLGALQTALSNTAEVLSSKFGEAPTTPTTNNNKNNGSGTPSTPTSKKPTTPATSVKSATYYKNGSVGMGAGGGALSGSGSSFQDYNNLLYQRGNKTKTTNKYWGKIGKDALKVQIDRGKKLGYSEFKVLQDFANTEALSWGEVLTAYINLKGKTKAAKSIISYFGKSPSDDRKKGWKNAFGKNYPKYEYGGLADFTGPAWLDGTQSKPELVLNSTDTKNFLALKDVLSHALSSTSSINNSYGGDATFEININVDHINSDYDVDKIAERVKRNIVKDSSYRNVTQVRKFR